MKKQLIIFLAIVSIISGPIHVCAEKDSAVHSELTDQSFSSETEEIKNNRNRVFWIYMAGAIVSIGGLILIGFYAN